MAKSVGGRDKGRRAAAPVKRSSKARPARKAAGDKQARRTKPEGRARRYEDIYAEALRKLRQAQRQVRSKTSECEQIRARFETALRGAQIHVFSQDRDLRYTWVYNPRGESAAAEMIGRTDDEIWSSPEQQAVVAVKRQVLRSGVPEDCEASYIEPQRRALYALHIDPVFAADRSVEGIMCAAIDISRIRSLESEQRRLTEELATVAQRYESALRGSNVTVFTQDTELRYTSMSKPLFGHDADTVLGRTDDELLPPHSAGPMTALKREVMQKGVPLNAELRAGNPSADLWYDFHIEPMRDVSGGIVGLTGAAVDITERKESEAHLRLLMRELTHRSKNLLAVIQAMARQTARRTGKVDVFLDYFSARLQALARAHDLLVAESWHGASLQELVRSQLAYYIDREPGQVRIDGPDIQLKPEAAQSLGLALHELATNAAQHGALSRAGGQVEVTWRVAGDGIELLWRERSGPRVSAPRKRGFGSIVIEHNLARTLDGQVALDFAAEGLTCRVAVPEAQLAHKLDHGPELPGSGAR